MVIHLLKPAGTTFTTPFLFKEHDNQYRPHEVTILKDSFYVTVFETEDYPAPFSIRVTSTSGQTYDYAFSTDSLNGGVLQPCTEQPIILEPNF